MTPGDLLANYMAVGQRLTALTQPYALHLLLLLGTIECIVIGLTYTMDADGPGALFGRGIRFIFLFGFAYWWIENAWSLATIVLGSFNQLGQTISGIPELTPVAFFKTASSIAEVIYQAPTTTHLLPDLGLAFAETVLAALIFVAMGFLGAVVIFVLAAAWLIVGPGVILVPLMVNRFTARIAEGYFTWLVRTGVLILFFYVVLGTAQLFATQWNASLTTACAAGADGKCTLPIPIASLISLLGSSLVLSLIGVGVPWQAAHIVTGGVNMALEHLASAKYIGSSITRALSHHTASQSHSSYQSSPSSNTLQQRLQAGSQAAQQVSPRPPSQIPTQRSLRP